MNINGNSCDDCGLPGEPVPGQEDVYAWAPPMPPDHALTDLSAPDVRADDGMVAPAQSRIQLLEGIPPPDMPATPITRTSRPTTMDPPHSEFIESMIHEAISDAAPSDSIEYLPRLGAPWLELDSGHRRHMRTGAMQLLTAGFGSIPGFPDKYRPVIPSEILDKVQDYLDALDQVLRILRGEYVSPMLGGKKAGLIQGWTYVVDENDRIYLKPWRKGVPPVPLPQQPKDPNQCRLFPWDAGMTVVANNGELPVAFGLRIYRQVAREQNDLANTGEFAVVVHVDQSHALIVRGECIGKCSDPLETCRPRYLTASWDDDLRKDLETEESLEAPPSLAEDEPPGTLQFATSVTCECQRKE